MLIEFFTNNLDIVFLVYGFGFTVMGIAILVQPRRESIFRLSDIIWLLAVFGLSHGLNEWLDMFAIIKGYHSSIFNLTRLFLLSISYLFLLEFGRRFIFLSFEKFLNKWLTIALSLSALVFIFTLEYERSIWPRYLLGFPGATLSAFGFTLYYRTNKAVLKPLGVYRYFLIAASSLFLYGILGGVITPKADFFPASIINTVSFFNLFGIPVQAFRALCSIALAWSVYNILGIFNWEIREKLKRSLQNEHKKAVELEAAYQSLEETQDMLIQSEKLAVIGQLAAGVSHEINNPLFAISAEAEMLLKDKGEDKDTKEAAEIIIEQSKRIKAIIKRLLEFSRKSKFEKRPLDVNDVIEKSISLLSYQARMESIEIVKELDINLPKVFGDNNQLQEVFLNIMLNSVQAMEKGGRLTIKTRREKITKYGRRNSDIFKLNQEIVVIEFIDTGKGMDEETLKKVFNPFFSTKEKSTGLGLTICHEIIRNHNGIIKAQSKLKEGSTFLVKLPIPNQGGDDGKEKDFGSR